MTPRDAAGGGRFEILRTGDLSSRERYQLLTSLVVPRPIGWISSQGRDGGANLAPFSFYTALSSSPMLVGVSVGHRNRGPKDSLRNARESGGFCVNVVGEEQLEAMNDTAGDFGPEVDEARRIGLTLKPAASVDAPYVVDAPAVLECSLFRTIELGEAANTLIIGEVGVVRLSEALRTVPGTRYVDAETFRPVARLYGRAYGLLGEVRFISRGREERS